MFPFSWIFVYVYYNSGFSKSQVRNRGVRKNGAIGRKILSIAWYSWILYNIHSTRGKGKNMTNVVHDVYDTLKKQGWVGSDPYYSFYMQMYDNETGCRWDIIIKDDMMDTYVVKVEYIYFDTGETLYSFMSSGTYKHIRIADYTNMMRKVVTGINTINSDIEHDRIVDDFKE